MAGSCKPTSVTVSTFLIGLLCQLQISNCSQVRATQLPKPQERLEYTHPIPPEQIGFKPKIYSESYCPIFWKLTKRTSTHSNNLAQTLRALYACRPSFSAAFFEINPILSKCFIGCTGREQVNYEYIPKAASVQFKICCTACSGYIVHIPTNENNEEHQVCEIQRTNEAVRGPPWSQKLGNHALSSVLKQEAPSPTPNVKNLNGCFINKVRRALATDLVDYDGKYLSYMEILCKCYNQPELYPKWMHSSRDVMISSNKTLGCIESCLHQEEWKQCASLPKLIARDGVQIINRDCCKSCGGQLLDSQILTNEGERVTHAVCAARTSSLWSILPTPSPFPTALKVLVPPAPPNISPSFTADKSKCRFTDTSTVHKNYFINFDGAYFDRHKIRCICSKKASRGPLFPVSNILSLCVDSCLSKYLLQSCGSLSNLADFGIEKRVEALYRTCCFLMNLVA